MGLLFAKIERAFEVLSNLPRGMSLIWAAGKIWVVAQIFVLVIRGMLPAFLVYLTKLFIDSLIAAINDPQGIAGVSRVISIGVTFGILTLLFEILGSVSRMIYAAHSENLTDHVFALIHKKSVKADLAYFEQPEFFDHLHRAQLQARSRPAELNAQLGSLLQNAVTMIGMGIVLARFGLWLPIVLLISTLPTFYVVLYSTSRLHKWQREKTAAERRSWYFDALLTRGDAVAEIKLFNLGSYFRSKFVKIRAKLRKQQLRLALHQRALEFGASVFSLLLAAVIFVWIVSQAIKGAGTVGDLALFYQVFNQGQNLMRTFLQDIGKLYSNCLFLSDLFEYLDLEPQIVTPKEFADLPDDLVDGISFENVTFRYESRDRDAIDKLNLVIPAKKITAVVGSNGAGKSTLIKLLCRFYDPNNGKIMFDGIDLRDLSLEELHRNITVLFQAPVRYSATVSENIALGDIERRLEDNAIKNAATDSGADEILEKLPKGYNQMLGRHFSGGHDLSTGEWQRIALARAFFRKSPILLLDEPTSAMDPWAEADWIKKFLAQSTNKTVLIITHRFTTASQADLIYVMKEGRIVESGSHGDLIRLDGSYARSWKEQIKNYSPALQ